MPSARPDGICAEPLAPLAMPDGLLKTSIGSPAALQVALPQTRKSIVPVLPGSGSLKLPVRVGVAVVTFTPSAGPTVEGVSGAPLTVSFVTACAVYVAAWFFAGSWIAVPV